MKVIVTFSGGKDSLAALLWTREHITRNFTTIFCGESCSLESIDEKVELILKNC